MLCKIVQVADQPEQTRKLELGADWQFAQTLGTGVPMRTVGLCSRELDLAFLCSVTLIPSGTEWHADCWKPVAKESSGIL